MRSDYVEEYDWEPPEGRVVGKSDDLDEWNTNEAYDDDDDSYDEGFGPSRRGPRRRGRRQQPFRAQRRPRRGGGRQQAGSRRAASGRAGRINLGGLSGSRREKLEKRRRQLELELSAINAELTGGGRKSTTSRSGNGFGQDSSLFRSSGGNVRKGRSTNQNAEFSGRNELSKEQLDKELDDLRFSGAGGDEQRKVEAATSLDDDLDAYFAAAPKSAPSTTAAKTTTAESAEKDTTNLPTEQAEEPKEPVADTAMETNEVAEETPVATSADEPAVEEGKEPQQQAEAAAEAESPAAEPAPADNDAEMAETPEEDAPPEGTVEDAAGQES